jgi:hypothetical protein
LTSSKKRFSLRKPTEVSETELDSKIKIKPKKDHPSRRISFTKKSKVNVPVIPVPEPVKSVTH